MVEELQTILNGKEITIKNKHYLSTSDYIQPFIDRLAPFNVDFRCQVKVPDQITGSEGQLDVSYIRVNIQAIFPKETNKQYRRVLCMVYGLDLKTPVAKFYIGALNDDNNFIVFNQESISIQEIEPDTPLNYNSITQLLEKTDNINAMLNAIQSSFIDRDMLYKYLGEWIDFTIDNCFFNECGKIKLSSSVPVDAYKLLIKEKDSEFYIPSNLPITVYDLYNTFLSLIKYDDKDIINQFEKTILINRLLRL